MFMILVLGLTFTAIINFPFPTKYGAVEGGGVVIVKDTYKEDNLFGKMSKVQENRTKRIE